ncbi:hypothetical protein ACVW0K_007412 [Streptomyces filamentosus]
MNTNPQPTTYGDDDIRGMAQDYLGVHPALDRVLEGLIELTTVQAGRDQAVNILMVLGYTDWEGTVPNLIGQIVRNLCDPERNALLPHEVTPAKLVRAQMNSLAYAEHLEQDSPDRFLAEVAWDLDPHTD